MAMAKYIICYLFYSIIGLVMNIQLTFGDHCNSEFSDIKSHALETDIVVYAKLAKKIPTGDGTRKLYDGLFSVKKVFKTPKDLKVLKLTNIKIGPFGPKTDTSGPCLTEVQTDAEYFLFLNASSKEPFRITHLPVKYNKTDRRSIRKIVCRNCAKAPVINTRKLKDVHILTQNPVPLRLVCEARHGTKPGGRAVKITWYKDGKLIRKHVKANKRRMRSRLRIKKPKYADSGEYTCVIKNAAGSAEHRVKVTILEGEKCKPSENGYCWSRGTCYRVPGIDTKYCLCLAGFAGVRCEKHAYRRRTPEIEEDDNTTIIVVCAVVGGCIMLAILIAIFLVRRRRKRPGNQTNIINASSRAEHYTIVPNGGSVNHIEAERIAEYSSNSQTGPGRLVPLETFFPRANGTPPALSVDGCHGDQPRRDRLQAISGTPVSVHRLNPVSDDKINAILSKKASPGQNSKTESLQHMRRDSSSYSSDTEAESIGTTPEYELPHHYNNKQSPSDVEESSELDSNDPVAASREVHAGREPSNKAYGDYDNVSAEETMSEDEAAESDRFLTKQSDNSRCVSSSFNNEPHLSNNNEYSDSKHGQQLYKNQSPLKA